MNGSSCTNNRKHTSLSIEEPRHKDNRQLRVNSLINIITIINTCKKTRQKFGGRWLTGLQLLLHPVDLEQHSLLLLPQSLKLLEIFQNHRNVRRRHVSAPLAPIQQKSVDRFVNIRVGLKINKLFQGSDRKSPRIVSIYIRKVRIIHTSIRRGFRMKFCRLMRMGSA